MAEMAGFQFRPLFLRVSCDRVTDSMRWYRRICRFRRSAMDWAEMSVMRREALLETIRRIARENGQDTVSLSQFRARPGCSNLTFRRHFRYWNDAVEAAGLKPAPAKRNRDRAWKGAGVMARDELLEAIRKAGYSGRNAVSKRQFMRVTGFSVDRVKRHYRYWNDAVRDAGLRPLDSQGWVFTRLAQQRVQMIFLLRAFTRNCGGRCPTFQVFRDSTGISAENIARAFGGWKQFLSTAFQKS